MQTIEDESRARRRARAIASDVSVYNEDKITEGIEHDNLFELLEEELEEGRALFEESVTPEIYAKNLYWRAVIDIIVRSKPHIRSTLW
ncbi:MAG: hypothetical protein KC543_07330 [Myxococcales bacterium]|nr:hypothetical protein [Myxococcales bacterium]